MDGMTNCESPVMEGEGKSRLGAVGAVASMKVLLVGYVISIGPAIWFQAHGYMHPDVHRLFYAPLIWICERIEPLNDLANWWIDLWRYLP
jgi:hypothetical protein